MPTCCSARMRSITWVRVYDWLHIPVVEALLLVTKPVRVHPTVTGLHYKIISFCDACERHAPSLTINVYGANTTHYDIASMYTPAPNTAQTKDTPLYPDPIIINYASSDTEPLPTHSPQKQQPLKRQTTQLRQSKTAKAIAAKIEYRIE